MGTRHIILIGLIIVVCIGLFYCFNLQKYISLSYLQEKAHEFSAYVEHNYFKSLFIYGCVTMFIVALSIPAVGPVTLLGGFLFGTIPALCVATIAVPLGATLAFLCIRHFFVTSAIIERFTQKYNVLVTNIHQYGASYLLTLNLLTIVPFFVISTLAAITNVPLQTFMWTSAVGSFPMLAVYAFAGRTFADITSIRDIFSPSLIVAFILLALLSLIPMLLKKRIHRNVHK